MLADCVREIEYEIFEKQNRIIRIQSDAINGLVALLAQHKDVDCADFDRIKEGLDTAMELRLQL